jgi:hypothetical protein
MDFSFNSSLFKPYTYVDEMLTTEGKVRIGLLIDPGSAKLLQFLREI